MNLLLRLQDVHSNCSFFVPLFNVKRKTKFEDWQIGLNGSRSRVENFPDSHGAKFGVWVKIGVIIGNFTTVLSDTLIRFLAVC